MVRSTKHQQSVGSLYSSTDVNWDEVGREPDLRILVLAGRDLYLDGIPGVLRDNPNLINQDYRAMFMGIFDFAKSIYLTITIFRMVA